MKTEVEGRGDGWERRTYDDGRPEPFLVERRWRDEIAEHHEVTVLVGGHPAARCVSSRVVETSEEGSEGR